MKVTFLLENLQKELPFLNHAVSLRTQLPILSNFLLQANKGKLKVCATDLEIGIIVEIPAKVEEEGETAVPAKPLSDLLGSVKNESLSFETKEKTLEIGGKGLKSIFQTAPAEDFPKLFEEKGEELVSLKKGAIEKDLQKVVFAASQDSSRPAFSGVLIKQDKEGVLMVATDAHRLSLKISPGTKTKTAKGLAKPILVSSKTLRVLLNRKTSGDVSVFVSNKNNQIIFIEDQTILVGRLIDAEYPEYDKIIPGDFSTRAEFDRNEMMGAVRTASVFARETANIIKFSVRKEGLQISAKTQGLGENTVDVAAKTTGEENEIAFNGRYLLDLLSNVEEETMVFEMTGPLNPGVFKIAKDDTFIHLIMPIRVRDEELRE